MLAELPYRLTRGKCNRSVPWRNQGRLSMRVKAELLLRKRAMGPTGETREEQKPLELGHLHKERKRLGYHHAECQHKVSGKSGSNRAQPGL